MRRWVVWGVLLAAAAVAAAWIGRELVLAGLGQLLVAEDSAEKSDVIVVSKADLVGDALEAARLYREGYGAEIVMPPWEPEQLASPIHDLGIPFLSEWELAAAILARSGVPDTAVHVLPGFVDGTDTEIAAVAGFIKERRPASLLFVTARSHTARARWLLHRALPPTTRLLVRAPRTDPFQADAWWRSREHTREVFTEYLRWFNTSILGDPWAGMTTRPAGDGRPQ